MFILHRISAIMTYRGITYATDNIIYIILTRSKPNLSKIVVASILIFNCVKSWAPTTMEPTTPAFSRLHNRLHVKYLLKPKFFSLKYLLRYLLLLLIEWKLLLWSQTLKMYSECGFNSWKGFLLKKIYQ